MYKSSNHWVECVETLFLSAQLNKQKGFAPPPPLDARTHPTTPAAAARTRVARVLCGGRVARAGGSRARLRCWRARAAPAHAISRHHGRRNSPAAPAATNSHDPRRATARSAALVCPRPAPQVRFRSVCVWCKLGVFFEPELPTSARRFLALPGIKARGRCRTETKG